MSVYNAIYKKLIALTGYTSHDIRAAIDAAGLDISRSRQVGWTHAPDNRRFYRMTDDELIAVLDALIDYENARNE